MVQLAALASVVGQANATSGLELSDEDKYFAHYCFCAVIALMTCISVYRITKLYLHAHGYGGGFANAAWMHQFVGTARTYLSGSKKAVGVFSTTPHVTAKPKSYQHPRKGIGVFPAYFCALASLRLCEPNYV